MRKIALDHLNGADVLKTGDIRQYGSGVAETVFAKPDAETWAAFKGELAQRHKPGPINGADWTTP